MYVREILTVVHFQEDKNLWLPGKESLPKCLEFSMSKTLIEHLGDQFCALVKEENEAAEMSNRKRSSQIGGKEGRAAWKRVIKGVRDMCDVCETTLFNYHWACEKCGFVVCIACYKSRKNNTAKVKKIVIISVVTIVLSVKLCTISLWCFL